MKSNSERAEFGLEGEEVEEADEMLDENLETLHPNKMRRTHSKNGDLLGDQVGVANAMDVALIEALLNSQMHCRLDMDIVNCRDTSLKMMRK